MEGSICATGERGVAANVNRGDGGRFAAGGRGAGGDSCSRERRAKRGERGRGWRERTFHLHTRGPFLVADHAGNAMAGHRGRRERGGSSTRRPSFLGATERGWIAGMATFHARQPGRRGRCGRGWRCGRGQREWGRRGRRERGRRQRGRDSRGAESGGARESGRL
jgi:hypothetical protein